MSLQQIKYISSALLLGAASAAHSAPVDLTTFTSLANMGATASVTANLATLALPEYSGPAFFGPQIFFASSILSNVTSFEYSATGIGTRFSLTPANSTLITLQGSTDGFNRYDFATPYSGKLIFSFGSSSNSTAAVASIRNVTLITPVAAVPEPETYAMLLGGLGLMGAVAARRRPRRSASIRAS